MTWGCQGSSVLLSCLYCPSGYLGHVLFPVGHGHSAWKEAHLIHWSWVWQATKGVLELPSKRQSHQRQHELLVGLHPIPSCAFKSLPAQRGPAASPEVPASSQELDSPIRGPRIFAEDGAKVTMDITGILHSITGRGLHLNHAGELPESTHQLALWVLQILHSVHGCMQIRETAPTSSPLFFFVLGFIKGKGTLFCNCERTREISVS
jgi:hypothetical protein